MSLKKALLITLGIGSTVAVSACGGTGSGTDTPPPGTSIDYSKYMGAAPVSFRGAVMPIFGMSCTASDCHKAPEKKAKLYLGVRCLFDSATKTCNFPTVPPDPNGTATNPPMPLTDQIVNDVYASLMENSSTTPSHKRVVAGDPEHSFLVQKCAGTESKQGYSDCVNQDPSHTASPVPCGASMPLNSPALSEGTSRPRFDTLATWVAQGALNN